MRDINVQEEKGMLVLSTPELNGYTYLQMEEGKAITSFLDDKSCRDTFDCSANELKKYIKAKGY